MKNAQSDPVAIGGLGGSGTRLIANILMGSGIYLGGGLNKALDNLWFTLLFRRPQTLGLTEMEFDRLVGLFINAMIGRRSFSTEEQMFIMNLAQESNGPDRHNLIKIGAETMLAASGQPRGDARRWGWKEPNTHIVIDRWFAKYPRMKYIHVMRNGLDMAFSPNQNQLKLWGRQLLGEAHVEVTPRNSLRFWCFVHRRLFDMRATLGGKLYLLRYDDFCSDPGNALASLCGFLGLEPSAQQIEKFLALVSPPESVGRYKQHGLDMFDVRDVDFVRSLGFDT